MSMSVVESSFQVIPSQEPSNEYKGFDLHESIINGFSINQSHVKKNKQNNNSMPLIQTHMLNTFNPEAYHPIPQQKLQTVSFGQKSYQKISSVPVRSLSENPKTKVNFSYGFGNQNALSVPQNGFSQGMNRNCFGNGMNMISGRTNNFFTDQFRHNSMENNRPFSNLSELSKSKKAYPEVSSNQDYQLKQFINEKPVQYNNEQVKTHKLGKKFKTVKFVQKGTQKNHNGANQIVNGKLRSNNESFEMFQSPRKNNMSMLSMQRSQYVFLTEDQGQKIEIMPQSYLYSQNNIISRHIIMKAQQPQVNNRILSPEHSLIYPVQEKHNLSQIDLRANQEHVHYRKSPKKIDNRIYLEENDGLKTLQGKGSRLTEIQNINKLSRITLKDHLQHEILLQPHDILSKQDLLDFDNQNYHIKSYHVETKTLQNLKKAQKQSKQQQNESQTTKILMTKISELQEKLHKKQQENINLLKRIQNQQIEKKINSQFEKLQLISRLNQIEIQKLKNQIKMFKIKQKFHINTQKQRISQINDLKRQLKLTKNNHFQSIIDGNLFGKNRTSLS